MSYLILGFAVLIGCALAVRWYVNASPPSILRVFKWVGIIGLVIIGFVIILTRQFAWAAVALPALFPWFLRARQASRLAKNWSRMSATNTGGSGSAPDQTSEIETRYLLMYLVHDTGEMNGNVILGNFSGRTLRSLTFEELVNLMLEVRGDNHSVQVLTAYMERYHGEKWREQTHSGDQEGYDSVENGGLMTREEAYKVLGLDETATDEQVKDAHRRLIRKFHPDHGGSTYLATVLNEAKDLLLGQ